MEVLLVVLIGAAYWAATRKGGGSATVPGAPLETEAGGIEGSMMSYIDSLERKWEGWRATVYNDGAGNPTIAYGHKLKPGESYPNGVTPEEGAALLAQDMAEARAAVQSQVKVPLTQGQFAALVDWVFNLGPGKLKNSTLLQKLNAGDYASVPGEMARWDYVAGAPSAGVEARRLDEGATWNS